jgi:hypothetical protein
MKSKLLISFLVAIMLVALQVGAAAAAPAAQDPTPVVGTVAGVTLLPDGTVDVDVLLSDGTTHQTVNLTAAQAEAAGLVTVDPITGEVTVNDGVVGLAFDSSTLAEEDACAPSDTGEAGAGETVTGTETGGEDTSEDTGEGGTHPVGDALSQFFCGTLGTSYDDIMTWHDDGFGFGVIAQALWISTELGLNPDDILAFKKGDFVIVLEDGTSPTNWGQLRKAAFSEATDDYKHNLGEIMSGRADPLGGEEVQAESAGSDTVHGQGYLHSHKGTHHPHH